MSIDPRLAEILVCPDCHGSLEAGGSEPTRELTCAGCGLVYPVQDDIPVLLVDEARRPPRGT